MPVLRTSSWTLVVLLCSYCALAGASLGKMIPLIPDLIGSLAASPVQVSLLLSVVAAVAAVLAPAAGWFGDRFGDRLLLLCGLVLLGVGTVVGALGATYPAVFAGRCIEGAGYICMLTAVAALMMRVVEGPRLTAAMSLFGAAIPAGIGVGEALAGLTAGGVWRNAFWGHGAAVLLGLAALTLVPAWRKAEAHAHGAIDPLEIYRKPAPVRLGLCMCLLTLMQFGVTSLFPSYVHTVFGLPLARAAAFGAAGLLASIVGSVVATAALSSEVKVRTLVYASFGAAGVAGAAVFAGPRIEALSITASIVFFIAGGFATGLMLAVLPRVLPDPAMRGRAGGLVNQCSNVGIFAAPPLAAAILAGRGGVGVAVLVAVTAVLPVLIMPFAAASRRIAHGPPLATAPGLPS